MGICKGIICCTIGSDGGGGESLIISRLWYVEDWGRALLSFFVLLI